MKLFIDSSIFLKLLLDEPGANKAQLILEMIEHNKAIGYITPLILEEISFKLIYAKASEILNTKNIWKIREALKLDDIVRKECVNILKQFYNYVEYMLSRGLRIEYITYSDWIKSLNMIEKYGILSADAIHIAIALRIGVNAIATFDEDFKIIKEVKIIP